MENKIVVLAIDPAEKTGWAIYKNGRIAKHGTKHLAKSTCGKYFNWLAQMIGENEVTHIVAEAIFREATHKKDKAFWSLAAMQGVLCAVAENNNIDLSLIEPQEAKTAMIPNLWLKLFPFKGDKQKIRQECKRLMVEHVKFLGYELENDKADDEADAIGILITYLQNNNIPVTHPNHNRR